MVEMVDVAAAANTSREAARADGGGADPIWRGTVEGCVGA